MERIPEKVCSHCKTAKPATLEFFKLGNKLKDGTRPLSSWCRECHRAGHARWKNSTKGQQYHAALQQHHRDTHPVRTKTCMECNATHPYGSNQFSPGKPYCRTCGERRREEARERTRARRRAVLAAPTRTCSTCKNDLPNTEAFFNMKQSGNLCHACRLKSGERWAKANPLAIRAKTGKRRAMKRNAGGTYRPAHVQRQFEQQDGRCYWCRTLLHATGKDKYHVDHLIALAKGGTNGPENIVCACPTCNQSKSDRMPWEFAGRLL